MSDQKITNIVPSGKILPCKKIVDCSNKLILPYFIDPHVHINLDLGEFAKYKCLFFSLFSYLVLIFNFIKIVYICYT